MVARQWISFAFAITHFAAVAAAADSFARWLQYRDAVTKRPDVLRYYTFENVSQRNPSAQSLAGQSEPLRYIGPKPLQIVPGRWPQKRAVRLDKGCFQAKPIPVAKHSFTVECWFSKQRQGSLLGNGRTNGMIFAQGDGYWCGFRVWAQNPSKRLRFEIGRPKPKSAVGLTTDDPAPDGVWHHLAATWDGKTMRLYLDGVLLRAANYAGPFTPTEKPLKIGYADAGVGSLVLDVDEAVAYGRALSPTEILYNAHLGQALPKTVEACFADADKAIAKREWQKAARAYEKAVNTRECPPEYRATARLARARSLWNAREMAAAVKQCVQLCDDPTAPDRLRRTALLMCVPVDKHAPNPIGAKDLYQRLIALSGPEPSALARVRVALAEAALREGDAATAREQFRTLLHDAALTPRERRNLQIQIAHTYRYVGDTPRAREAYAKLAAEPATPPEFKSNAQLCIADTLLREHNYARAIDAFKKVLSIPNAPAHHRAEAQERIAEAKRMQRGLPARVPAAARIRIPPFPKPAATFYVAPDGADTNHGTLEKPFATLERARDAIRARKSKRSLPKGGVTVFVRGGVYRRHATFELIQRDSGAADAPIVYRAAPGETPRFLGSIRLRGFHPTRDPDVRRRLPSESRDRVLTLDMKAAGVADLGKINLRG